MASCARRIAPSCADDATRASGYSCAVSEDEADSTGPEPAGSADPRADPLLVALGARIREVRISKGHGVTETAAAAKLGKGHLWRIEAGGQNISVKILARIAVALGAKLTDLVAGVEPAPPRTRCEASARKTK